MADMLDVLLNLLQQKMNDPYVDIKVDEKLYSCLEEVGLIQADTWPNLPIVINDGSAGSIRVYLPCEMDKLSSECRGMLAYLERVGLIDFREREHLIETLLQLPETPVETAHLFIVLALHILFQPEKLNSYLLMQDLLPISDELH